MEGNAKRKGLMMLSAFLLALAITGGLFAYTYTTTTITLGTTPVQADYATVTANATGVPAYTFLGKTKGTIQAGGLFDVTRGAGYTGDLEVIVSLANVDELVEDYSFWMLRVEFREGATKVDMEESTQVLSLSNPEVSFIVDSANLTGTRTVYVPGGSYRVYPAIKVLPDNDPVIFCQVIQASQHQ